MNSKNDQREAGAVALLVIVCVVALAVCVSVAVGLHFGAAWGWTVAAAFVAMLLVALSRSLLRMTGRKDG